MNLLAWVNLTRMARRVGADFWTHRSSGGAGIQNAIDFLLPYAGREASWPHEQITPPRAVALLGLLRFACAETRDNRYAEGTSRYPAELVAKHRTRLYFDPSDVQD
jgi:hypothetical protein